MKLLDVNTLVKCGADRTAAGLYVDWFNILLPDYKITTHLRAAHFMGQLLHESVKFTKTEEMASGKAYEFSKSLGNTHPGDGVKFKGRGLIQITGRINYSALSRHFGIDCINHPEMLEEPEWAVKASLWYWGGRSLNSYADKDQVYQISCLINIGHVPQIKPNVPLKLPNGWNDRQQYVALSKRALAPLFV